MIHRFFLVYVLALSSTSFGADPFTIMQGRDALAPKQPQACIASNGSVHVAFGVGDQVYHCSIGDEGNSDPQAAFKIPNMSLGMRRGPRIAHTGSAITVTAIGGAIGKGRDGDVLAYRSLDNGKSWLGPAKVNDVEASAREGLHAMAVSETGTLWCVWLDLREKGTQLFASKSTDHGATWSKNRLVYRSPDGSICECCHPSIVVSNKSLHVLFRNSLKGNRDMYLVSSHDDGESFGDAVRLGQIPWQLNACPMDGGMLAMDQNQLLSTVWRRDRNVIGSTAKPNLEVLLGPGEQPWITSSDDGFYSVWTSKREGDLFLLKPASQDPDRISGSASFAVVVGASSPIPKVYAFWEKRSDQGIAIVGQRIK
ncbi:MAG: glycoside hydrolase [Pirellula sp.]|nr:glycoside hydrolase [Pirellula sp.]